ncbi:MAG: bifunctional folylpolyglutamate synthase/dihydrofolate synthase [Kiritimatiellae bacterium]|nr:bifunctional folylpolyglutamate synthase/dihydrofolate synthase [Kiritimatiellia bacterium]MDD5520409.1 bifunctional folylpolyglutamate synthase/dihydrofolate synthase [Kiritimatiellia bacterium]
MKDALERLYRRQTFGIKPGLDVIRTLLEKLGNPQLSYGIIHVAGTNGKGSVCAMLDSVLRTAGYKVGLYTSPHLVSFNERLCVGGMPISDDDLVELIERIECVSSEVADELKREPTFFECSTAMAFEYFRRKGVSLAVVEVGMGGRLDATNTVIPILSVITRVSLEHMVYLGSNIENIVSEKAGIIKPGKPVICGATDEKALAVIRRIAKERGSPLFNAAENAAINVISADLTGQKISIETSNISYGTMKLPLVGQHQVENLATVITTLEVIGDIIGGVIEPEKIKAGIAATKWNGRFHVLQADPPVILDGAHNPGAAEVLAETFRRILRGKPLGLIVGMCGDKDVNGFVKPFGSSVKKLWVVPVRSERNMPAGQIVSAGRAMGWEVTETTLLKAFGEAENWAEYAGGAVCVAGSLFLAGEVLEMVGEGIRKK